MAKRKSRLKLVPQSEGAPPDAQAAGEDTLLRLCNESSCATEMLAHYFTEKHPDLGYLHENQHGESKMGKVPWYRWVKQGAGFRWVAAGEYARKALEATWQEMRELDELTPTVYKVPASFETAKSTLLNFIRPIDADRMPDSYPHYALLSNSTVLDLKTMEVKENKREYLLLRALPVEYKSNPKAPRFLEAEKMWAAGDPDLTKTLRFMLALLILRGMQWSKIFFVVGRAGSGKSALLSLIEQMFGGRFDVLNEEALFHQRLRPTLNEDASAKTAVKFVENLVVAIDELSHGVSINDAMAKRASDPDTTWQTRKLYQDPVKRQSTARLIVCSNYYPRLKASDDALRDRLVVLPFEACIRNTEANVQNIRSLWQPELSDVFSIVVDTAREIIADGLGYNETLDKWVCKSSQDALNQMFELSRTPLEEFLLERVERAEVAAELDLSALLLAYNNQYGDDKKMHTNIRWLKRVFGELFRPHPDDFSMRKTGGERCYLVSGFKLKADLDTGGLPPTDAAPTFGDDDDEPIPW